MKCLLSSLLALLLSFVPNYLLAQDEEIEGLSSLAEQFVAAYNEKDIEAILSLYTSEAELSDDSDAVYASGISQIQEVFEESFESQPSRRLALEVLSVRQISTNVVIEEGFAYFSEEASDEVLETTGYSAVLVKNAEGWRIGASREIPTEAESSAPLADLYPLTGEWVLHGDQMKMELSLAVSPSGAFLLGSAHTSTPDEGDMTTEIRIGQDPSTGEIRWWTFDEAGGFAHGNWQQEGDSWLIKTEGTTADGEKTSAVQSLTFEDENTIAWESTHRFIDGQPIPDTELRLVRRPPEPELLLSTVDENESPQTDSKDQSDSVE